MLFSRYLQNTNYVKNALSEEELKKFNQTIALFKKYSKQYDFDWLMIAALSYQESGIDQTKVSHVGAIGAMQVMRPFVNFSGNRLDLFFATYDADTTWGQNSVDLILQTITGIADDNQVNQIVNVRQGFPVKLCDADLAADQLGF